VRAVRLADLKQLHALLGSSHAELAVVVEAAASDEPIKDFARFSATLVAP